ncbi:hypothetical protein [uncultured Corynebacterium sp.]|uniref:hypothetical protein n=1 Tax=uncultured Corynebacterium sp. TaxID=159447 RepID=UPI002621EC51|nr:hypothetical protein [uncultured Corynebacterium sp.]
MTSLDSATYVVPDHGFGVIHNLPVGDVSPEVFSELLESTAAEGGYFSAELGPRTAQEGFAVRIDDSLVGHLSAADSQAYALFDWILSAGLHPHATAHVSMTDASGEEWPSLNLLLPGPHLCIPTNNPPAQRWTMLPGESAATLTEFSKDVTGFPQTDEHYLVSLHTRGFLRRNTVDVYVNSTFLGSLPRDAAREIAPAVLDCTKSGRLAIAHGYFHYNADDRPALTIYAHNAANKHHAGLVLGVVAGGTAIMSAATAARAQAAPAVPGGTTAGATTADASATSGFIVTSAAGASGAVTSNLLAAAGVAVLVGGGATVATNLLSDDEALSDTNAPSTAPAPEGNYSYYFDGNGPKRPAHPATPRIYDADPTSGTSAQPPLADAPSSPTPHHHTYPSQSTKKPSAPHSPHADRAQTHAPASDNRRGHHSEPRGGHHGEDSQAISRAASAAAAAAMAAANDVASAPAPAPSQTTPAATPSSSSEPAPQVAAAKTPTATSSSSQSAEPSQTTESTKSTTSAEPSSAASSPAEPSDLPTSSTSTSEKTTSEKPTTETTTAASTEKQTAEPSSSTTSSATSEPTSEPTQAADPSTPTSASSTSTSAQPEPESSEPASSEPQSSESTAPTTTSPLLTSESEPEPAPETTIPGSELEPTPEPEKPAEPAEPAKPEEPGRPEEPEEPTTPPKVIVIVVEN